MKKSTMLLIVALGIGLTGCSTYIPFSYPENSLNIYNTYWDDFAGSIEEGKVYHYRNKGFSPDLQFKVLQVWDKSTVLGLLYLVLKDMPTTADIMTYHMKLQLEKLGTWRSRLPMTVVS